MSRRFEHIRESLWYERAYKITVAIKGFDGLVELFAGMLLILSPHLLHTVLVAVSGEALEHHGRFMRYIAEYVAHVDTNLARGGLLVVALFLLLHGIVKLALVWALMKEILWAYPYAIVALSSFFLYQLYVCIAQPSVGMALFTLLDAIIIWVVWGEWQKLKFQLNDKKLQE